MANGTVPPQRTRSREGLIRAGSIAWSVVGILVLTLFGLWLLYQVRVVFPPLVLALAIIFVLNPIVSRLERLGVKRVLATIGLYVVFLTIITLLGLALAPTLRSQFEQFGKSLPGLQADAVAWAEGVAGRFDLSLQDLTGNLDRLREQVLTGAGAITSFAGGAFHLALIFVLAPFIALYLMIDLPRLQKSFVAHLPPQYQETWLMLLGRCGQAVGGFFRGQLFVALIVGVLSSILLGILGVPFWLVLGLLIGFFNIIPFVGPFVGGGIAVIVAFVTGGLSLAIWTVVAMFGVQQFDNHVVSPYVMGKTLRLHPVTIILALVAGGAIAGLWGMLLAIPATAVGKILVLHYYGTHILGWDPMRSHPEIELTDSKARGGLFKRLRLRGSAPTPPERAESTPSGN